MNILKPNCNLTSDTFPKVIVYAYVPVSVFYGLYGRNYRPRVDWFMEKNLITFNWWG